MKDIFNEYVSRIFAVRAKRRRIIYIMLILSVLAAVDVFWTLHRVGIAMTNEFVCGKTEHIHSSECDIGNCELEEHTHTAECTSDISADLETEDVWLSALPDGLSDNWRENMTAIALSQIGYEESIRNFTVTDNGEKNGYTRYGQWYGNPYGEWNTIFVYFCMYYSGISTEAVPYGSGCMAWAENLIENSLLMPADYINAAAGDVIFLDSDYNGIADRTAIVTKLFDTENGPAIQTAEGDTENKTALTSYYRNDERIIGWLPLEQLNEIKEDETEEFEAEAFMENNITYLAKQNITLYLNNKPVETENAEPYIVSSGRDIVIDINLSMKNEADSNKGYAYFIKTDKETYDKRNDTKIDSEGNEVEDPPVPEVASWQYFRYENSYFYTRANAWIFSDGGTICNNNKQYIYNPETNTAVCRLTISPQALEHGGTPYNISYTYNSCNEEEWQGIVMTVVPPEIVIDDGTERTVNNHQTQDTAYIVHAGGSFTLYAETGLSESGYIKYDSRQEFLSAESSNNEANRKFIITSNNEYISAYAGFQDYGYTNPPDSKDDRTAIAGISYEVDDDKLKITAQYQINDDIYVENYRYNVIEFFSGSSAADKEQLWLDIQPAPSVSELWMIKPEEKLNDTRADHRYPIEGRKSITLQGRTNQFVKKTESEYNALTQAEKKKYIETTDENDDSFYVKTEARFWSFDYKPDAEVWTDTLVKKGGTVYKLNEDMLYITVEFTANEVDETSAVKITFYDGTKSSTEWEYYKEFYADVQKFAHDDKLVYILTDNGYKERHRINEYLEDLSGILTNTDGYVKNDENHPYIIYPGDSITMYTVSNAGKFTCLGNAINGVEGTQALEIEHAESLEVENGKNVIKKTYKASADVNVECNVRIIFDDYEDGKSYDALYVKILPNNTREVFDHCDIEIADGGKYTFNKEIIMPDGTKRLIKEIYESIISGINQCDIYGNNGDPVKSYNKDDDTYNTNDVVFLESDYEKKGELGSTQFEFTSKYTHSKKEFRQPDVNSVNFNVQLTLIPYQKKITYYDTNGTFIRTSVESFTGNSIVLENIDLKMTGQSVIDAVNKCPDHSGLDFTYIKPLENTISIEAAGIDLAAKKKLINGTLKEEQFLFRINDTKNDNDPGNDEIIYVSNNADGSIVVNNEAYTSFIAENTYVFIIEEAVPDDKKGVIYDNTVYKAVIDVEYKEDERADGTMYRRFVPTLRYIKQIKTGTSYDPESDDPIHEENIPLSEDEIPEFVNTMTWYELPSTGGIGTKIFYMSGGIITTAAIAMLLRRKIKEK